MSLARNAVEFVRRRFVPRSALPPGCSLRQRVTMTTGCRDADAIPKVQGAGEVFTHRGRRVQRMHEGTLVPADGYYGAWSTKIIRRLRGHHEPQEELLFHHLLRQCSRGARMIEVGAFWAYYTSWFLRAVPESTAVCVEPDAAHAATGAETLALNGLSATWVKAAVGRTHRPAMIIRRESDGRSVEVPCHSLPSLLDEVGWSPVDILHIDAQGAETGFLESIADGLPRLRLRFLVVSTHEERISGSPTTHEDCLRTIRRLGGVILAEHTVEESFSGDGLIVASLDPRDAAIPLPSISRNVAENAFLAKPEPPGGSVTLARTWIGTMLVRTRDEVIGRALRTGGRFEEDAVPEVVRFLRRTRGFEPGLFVDIGANVGTHLIRAIRGRLFSAGLAVEMDPDTFRLLTANAALNIAGPGPMLFNVAVGDREGEAEMERSPDNFGDHRIVPAGPARDGRYGEAKRSRHSVRMTTLDRVEAESGRLFDASALVWIDTQGYEGHVLAGATGIRSRPAEQRPVVVCEFWPYGVERAGGRERLFEFLQECAAVHDLRAPGWQSAAPLPQDGIRRLYDHLLAESVAKEPPYTDLLCLP